MREGVDEESRKMEEKREKSQYSRRAKNKKKKLKMDSEGWLRGRRKKMESLMSQTKEKRKMIDTKKKKTGEY